MEGVPPAKMRAEVTGIAGMFEVTKGLVSGTTPWNPTLVLPALQCYLSAGATAMGQTLQTLLEQNSHVPDVRTRVGIAVAVIATHAATNGGAAGQAAQRRPASQSTRR